MKYSHFSKKKSEMTEGEIDVGGVLLPGFRYTVHESEPSNPCIFLMRASVDPKTPYFLVPSS